VKFEWDDAKAIGNVKKHGITFGEATEVFYDPNALEGHDTEHSGEEDRFFIIGYSARRLLTVIFAQRQGDMIRIISARKPTPNEKGLYEQSRR
jgi:uncharacterized DUF497 family protein